MGVSGQRYAPAAVYPRERTPGTHCTGGWVAPEPVWTQRKNPLLLPGIEPRSRGRPARSQTLYRLSYPGSTLTVVLDVFIIYHHSIRYVVVPLLHPADQITTCSRHVIFISKSSSTKVAGFLPHLSPQHTPEVRSLFQTQRCICHFLSTRRPQG
jgi:hypothetical protein